MPTTPYAKLLASINSAPTTSGGLTVAASATVQLSAQSYVGWGRSGSPPVALWEIYGFPVGFSLPSGWSLDSTSGAYYVRVNGPPPVFTLGNISLWGKYMLRLTVNGGLKNNAASSDMIDDTTALSVASSTGIVDLGTKEDKQFGADWTVAQRANLRIIDAIVLSGGGAPVGGVAPPAVAALISQVGVAATAMRSDAQPAHGVQSNPTLHALADASNAGFMASSDFSKLLLQPNAVSGTPTTTDATPTLAVTVTAAANCGGFLHVIAIGQQGNNYITLESKQGFQCVSSVVVMNGIPVDTPWPSTALNGCSLNFNPNASTIQVQVIGLAATTITWTVIAYYRQA